ncbi:hypothetical protein B9P99_02445 [Candidatus Marsarchaeota G1 archaeon OSP_B]|jgi:Diadenosine tetraphosphate (Ap4A) hydrolase and other HIT family hydrolases|uniref:HIT domain-containing protein n=2 Tax=Candidatus Marsarchaeota group 1 TaxID=2203770 RepID=A0A2R6APJ4_9ARCH|nr:MAG: hypothetical protein B9Q00_06090 [Candidatus Marsarchaeota G1 archaeon OSP_C]PSN93391.1 MAG: hypothetical protein B9P99_02445 [Candidatus Marsarchaeota G1 archaeon OSP_B]
MQAYEIFRDNVSMAFLDSKPLFYGHTLLIPLAHYETLCDLPNELVQPIFANAKKLALAVKVAMSSDGILVLINNKVSQSVPHLHIHIIPRRFKDGLRGFLWPRKEYKTRDEVLSVQKAIREAFEKLGLW